jgi:FkbM family methyltransferase
LRKIDVEPVAFADNAARLHGTKVDGLEVLPVSDAVERFANDATFVTSVYNSSGLSRQLREAGVAPASVRALLFANPHQLLPHCSIDRPGIVLEESDAVLRARDLWADEQSQREYDHLIGWQLLREPGDQGVLPAKEIYFSPDIIQLRDDESFVDCGAFDGDSIRAFLRQTGGRFARIDAVEPDPSNQTKLETWRARLAPESRDRVHIHRVAASDRRATLMFMADAGPGSALSAAGTIEVATAPLTEVLAGVAPTFIKVDVEGAEAELLRGARGLIAEHAPTLAICLYHRISDMWSIPLLLQRMRPDYRFFLRRYAEDCWETVCYAIRGDRMPGR